MIPTNSLSVALVGVVLVTLAGCGSPSSGLPRAVDALTPYKVEVVQGNVVTQEQAAMLRPGMSRNEVRNLLGSPLLADVFHVQRWDYVFSIRRQGTPPKQLNVTVWFEGDRVSRFEGADLPKEADFVASIATAKVERVPKLVMEPAEIDALPLPTRDAAGRTESAPRRKYPPLEPVTP